MTKREKAIAYLTKQRDIELQMMKDMKNYISSTDKKYAKLKRNHVETIELIDYILMRL